MGSCRVWEHRPLPGPPPIHHPILLPLLPLRRSSSRMTPKEARVFDAGPHLVKMDPMVSVMVPKIADEKKEYACLISNTMYVRYVCFCVGNVTSIAFFVFFLFMNREKEREEKKRKQKNVCIVYRIVNDDEYGENNLKNNKY